MELIVLINVVVFLTGAHMDGNNMRIDTHIPPPRYGGGSDLRPVLPPLEI